MRSSLPLQNIPAFSLPQALPKPQCKVTRSIPIKTPPYRVTVRGRRRIEPQKQGSRVLAAILGGSNPSQRAVPGSFVLFEWLSLRRPWRSEGDHSLRSRVGPSLASTQVLNQIVAHCDELKVFPKINSKFGFELSREHVAKFPRRRAQVVHVLPSTCPWCTVPNDLEHQESLCFPTIRSAPTFDLECARAPLCPMDNAKID